MENTLVRLNASAGSGKTYSLVKNYIATLLKSSNNNKFRQLLAITFTNKAVAEMKNRILETLEHLSSYDGEDSPAMLEDLVAITGLEPNYIAQKAKSILKSILHNYAGFDVVTIDTLTHRIIRTFSKDLDLPSSFEVSLDQQSLTSLAVDALISRAGQDVEITDTLVNFALEKADDDKSWDIARDLNDIAQLLHKENDSKAIALLKDLSLNDFRSLEKSIKKSIKKLESEIQEIAQNLLDLLKSLNLEQQHFNRGSFYKLIVQATEEPEKLSFTGAKWKEDIHSHAFYTKSQPEVIKGIIDTYRLEFINVFETIEKLHFEVKLRRLFIAKLTPLSVLQLIQKELDLIKEDENLLLISDFNKIIGESLKDQPAAFIYERLGERYTNYFIDEFQDTSVLQWSNLVPLIENAISSLSQDGSPNSLLIVGDPKQAIYRWRGGEAEQFIELGTDTNPFPASFLQETLDTNYRSYEEIINFNNSFFSHIASVFEHPAYKKIYSQDNSQNINHKKGGYVSLEFIEAENVEEAHEIYPQKIIAIISEIKSEGRPASDICILTRNNKDGVRIAQVLVDHNIEVVSSESLLIQSSPVVVFLSAVLHMFQHPQDPSYRLEVLYFLGDHLKIEALHQFYSEHIDTSLSDFIDSLLTYNIQYSISEYESLSLYERLEFIIRAFDLQDKSDAYVVAFLDQAHQFSLKNNGHIAGFLSYWEEKKEKASIAAPLQKDAVVLMSIHKSKGLEFPIVIYPYADSELYRTRGEHHWYPLEDEIYGDFKSLMIGHSGVLENMNDTTRALYTERRNQQQFDAINVLYVALTRAVERLYLVSRFRESTNKISTYNDLILNYLRSKNLFEEGKLTYTFGTPQQYTEPQDVERVSTLKIPFTSTSKEDLGIHIALQATFLWDEKAQDAIGYGNLIHEVMAKVAYRNQEELAVQEAIYEGLIPASEKDHLLDKIKSIIRLPELTACFKEENQVYTERMILSSTGHYYIPDRVEIHPDGTATLLDYKTGVRDVKHKQQITTYKDLLVEMGFNIEHSFLIYINDTVDVLVV